MKETQTNDESIMNSKQPTTTGQVDAGVIKKNAEDCGSCYGCLKNKTEFNMPVPLTRMILCPICGNKRCPKATDHNLDCTNSNASGQPGSRY